MSDNNNSDNKNTNTIYIPPEVRNSQPMPRLVKTDSNNKKNGQRYYHENEQQYYHENEQRYYRGEQYPPPPVPPPYYNYGYGGNYEENPPVRNKDKRKKKRKKKHRKSFFARLLTSLLVIFLLIFGMYSCASIKMISKMDYVETSDRNRQGDALSRSYVTNVLLIGTDGRTDDERGRSDTMMLASINHRTNTLTFTSFMRDCYVEIPNYGWDRLNASYSYGGAELLMDTIERNFGIAIDNYISVNFKSFANIIESVGGIDVEVSDSEANEINTILQAEVNEIMGDGVMDDMLTSGGKLHLNGKQALAYARIRYIGNADFERTQRQREIAELVVNKIKTLNPSYLAKLATSVLPGIKTNIPAPKLYLLSLQAPLMLGYDYQQLQIPSDGTYYGDTIDGNSVLVVDFDTNYNVIYETAFDDE